MLKLHMVNVNNDVFFMPASFGIVKNIFIENILKKKNCKKTIKLRIYNGLNLSKLKS